MLMFQIMTYYALYEVLFMCVNQKCNFYFQKYDTPLIFIDFYRFLCEFPMILTDFLLPESRSVRPKGCDRTRIHIKAIHNIFKTIFKLQKLRF